MKFSIKLIFILFGGVLLLNRCATVGSPSGGPKDIDPPKVVQFKPPNRSTEFEGKDIEIKFNEYLNLNNVNQELIISPPMNKKPIVRTKGKGIIIMLEDSLRNSTTYTLNFGNAITDLNEGNVLENFEYVLSTGKYIDSMSVVGNIVQAFTLEPVKEPVTIGLFENLSDSAPLISIPSFIGRTNSSGDFAIRNVKTGNYRLFALQDGNNNLKYDMLSENIAFADSTLKLYPEYLSSSNLVLADTSLLKIFINDSLPTDSLGRAILDTIMIDSILKASNLNYSVYVPLYLFEEEDQLQFLIESNH